MAQTPREPHWSTQDCSICQEPLTKQPRRALRCAHLFHQACIDLWFDTGGLLPTCPICRHVQTPPLLPLLPLRGSDVEVVAVHRSPPFDILAERTPYFLLPRAAAPALPALPVAPALPALPVAPALPALPVAPALPALPVAPALPVLPVAAVPEEVPLPPLAVPRASDSPVLESVRRPPKQRRVVPGGCTMFISRCASVGETCGRATKPGTNRCGYHRQ